MSASEILRRDHQRKRDKQEQRAVRRGRRLVRLKEAMRRLGIRPSKFYADFVATGRLTVLELGPKARAVDEDELDSVIASLPVATIKPVVVVTKRKRIEGAGR